jgi:hypothetical protein
MYFISLLIKGKAKITLFCEKYKAITDGNSIKGKAMSGN